MLKFAKPVPTPTQQSQTTPLTRCDHNRTKRNSCARDLEMFLRPAAKGQTVLSYSACQAVCVPTQPKRSSQLQKLPTRTYLPTHPHTHKHTVRAISKVTDWRHNVASPLHVCVCLHGVLSTAAQCGACIPFHTHHPTPSPATLLLYELTNPYIPKPTRILLCFSFVLCNI